jgi:hypothetical protein
LSAGGKARSHYCRWFQDLAFNGLHDPELVFYSFEAWVTLKGSINSQNNIYWSTGTPHAVHELPLHVLKVGVWCVISAEDNWACVFSTSSSKHFVTLILSPFFDQLTDENKLYRHFMQDNAMAHTANSSVVALHEFLGNEL